MGWIAAVLTLVIVAGLGAWLLWPGDGERPSDQAGTGQSQEPSPSNKPSASQDASQEATDEPSEEPSATEEPTQEPSTDPAAGAGGTRAEMQSFVQDYFATVTSDPESTFAMLTPEFQAASGGYERYAGFWSTISSATPSDIQVDPGALTASYTIDYVTTSGDTKTQQVQLQLEQQGDGFLIAGEG